MDWNAAIEKNREALKRVLTLLVGMLELGMGQPQAALASNGSTDCRLPAAYCRLLLPRHLHLTILRLLRPAEAAARRLVVVAARGLVVTLASPRNSQPISAIPRNTLRNGIATRSTSFGPPPLKGEGKSDILMLGVVAAGRNAAGAAPSPLRGGVRGGGSNKTRRSPGFSLFDPPRRWPVNRPARSGVPRIWFPGADDIHRVREPSPFDAIDATRLTWRLAALSRALDDLPRQARRLACWRARLDAALHAERHGSPGSCKSTIRRMTPLRGGRPPGWRRRASHEVHEILDVAHGLAIWAREKPRDTS